MQITTIEIVLGVILLATIAFSIYSFLKLKKISDNFSHIIKNVDGKNLEEILKEQFNQLDQNSEYLLKVKKELDDFKEFTKSYVQKMGFKRYNPFHETGGNQSFILVLLDRNNNGMILSSLHQRDMTRVYGKSVMEGQSEQKLSKEEEELLKQTIG
ncbi:DUF4446 family protein [Patescibacteria group bacterium]